MSTPVIESIAQVIVARLEDITLANGYAFDVSSVVRPDRKGNATTFRHLSIIVEQGPSIRVPDADYPGNPVRVAYRCEFTIKGIVRDTNTDTQARSVNDNVMSAAITRAITNHGGDWYSFSGYASECDLGDSTPIEPDDELTGVQFVFPVLYRHPENDPATVGA
jgi:hypothetical protein